MTHHLSKPIQVADYDHNGRGCMQQNATSYSCSLCPYRTWNRESLREFYQPWRDVEAAGAQVHIGECGCYNKTPNDVALRWFADLFGLFKEFGCGFALWNFAGEFGIVEHGRPGAVYEEIHRYKVDRALLDLILASRVVQ